MNDPQTRENDIGPDAAAALTRVDEALTKLEKAPSFSKMGHVGRLLDSARRLLSQPEGPGLLYERAVRLDEAGLFEDSDWARPESLQARMVPQTFDSGDARLITLECLSELRLLAVARGDWFHPRLSAEQAEHFLTQVLAFNLQVLFGLSDESTRAQSAGLRKALDNHLNYIASHIGFENILDHVVDEVWRLLRQRPIQVDNVRLMVTRIAACLFDPEVGVNVTARGAERLVSALFGPTQGCQEDPGVATYTERLAAMDAHALEQEIQGFARAMHDTGLVSPYHAVCLRHVLDGDVEQVARVLGLSTTGRDCLLGHQELVSELVREYIHVDTCQAIYGLSRMLERGVLYYPSVADSLWRQMQTQLHPEVKSLIARVFGDNLPPRAHLMSAVLSILGLPLGVDQGDNPACQSTRALSMWAYNEPAYLLQLVHWAARDNDISAHFEGETISSTGLAAGLVSQWSYDLDALSLVLVPHLDRIYIEMGRRTAGRGEDPHRWINPEFHGWWVYRGFAIAVDVHTEKLVNLDGFIRTFYTLYDPRHNGNTPVVHPQPAGIAVTDSQARFVGWHAITIMRVAPDQEGEMRVYFYNPNNDSGQDWGNGVVVSTEGVGEQFGESSLPIAEFCSRLYLFHYDERDYQILSPAIPEEDVARVKQLIIESWGADKLGEFS